MYDTHDARRYMISIPVIIVISKRRCLGVVYDDKFLPSSDFD